MRFQPPPGFARYPSSTGNRAVSTASREAFASEHHSPFPASTCRPGRAGHDPAHLRQRRAPPRPLCARTHVAPLSPGCGRSRPELESLHSARARRGGAILGRESPLAPLPRDSPRQATPLSRGSPAQYVMRGPYHALWPPLTSPFADRARSGPDPPRGLGAWRSHKFFFGPSTACTWGGSPWKCASNAERPEGGEGGKKEHSRTQTHGPFRVPSARDTQGHRRAGLLRGPACTWLPQAHGHPLGPACTTAVTCYPATDSGGRWPRAVPKT